MSDPFGFPVMPPHIQAMLARGQYSQALREGGKAVAREIVKKGPRIVQPIARTGASLMRAGGYMAEADGIVTTAGVLEVSEGAAVLYAAEQLAAGWTAVLGAGAAVAEAIPPVACFCLLVGAAWLLAHGAFNPRQAPGVRQQLRDELATARKSRCFCSSTGATKIGFRAGTRLAFQQPPLPTGCSFPSCQRRAAA